jgi:hypothetical protein
MKAIKEFFINNWLSVIVLIFVCGTFLMFWNTIRSFLIKTGLIKPSKADKYAYVASQQHEAMYTVGTDLNQLFQPLKGLKVNELKKIFNEFDYRDYIAGGKWFGLGNKLNLIQWYRRELSGIYLDKMKQIWSGTGLFDKFPY